MWGRASGLVWMLCAGLAAGPLAAADDAALRQILEEADAQRRTRSSVMELRMTLVDGQRRWVRQCRLETQRPGDGKAAFLQRFGFTAPADLAGSAVLTREEAGDLAQWIFLPAFHVVRRVPPSGRGEAYLGTDYFYEDTLDVKWPQYSFEDLGDEKVGGLALKRVAARPTDPDLRGKTAYSRIVYYVDTARRLIVRQDYSDTRGRMLKRLDNAEAREYGRYLLWDRSVMENLLTGHQTITEVLKRSVDVAVDEDRFTVRSLKRETE